MPTISKNKNASPPTTARLITGDRIIAYDVYLKDGKYTVDCDVCSQSIVVGKGAYTRHGADRQNGNMATKAVAKQPPTGIAISALLSCGAPCPATRWRDTEPYRADMDDKSR